MMVVGVTSSEPSLQSLANRPERMHFFPIHRVGTSCTHAVRLQVRLTAAWRRKGRKNEPTPLVGLNAHRVAGPSGPCKVVVPARPPGQ
eukprot:4671595-Alexandrium_andersonii.AAC.1